MKRKVLVCLALFGLVVANAKSYTVRIFDPVRAGSTELEPGEYKMEVDGGKVVIRNGTIRGEFNVKVETVDNKYGATSLRLAEDGGKKKLVEIHLGGTKTKLVLE